MWKFAVACVSIVMMATVVSNTLQGRAKSGDALKPLGASLASIAAEINAKRGTLVNGVKIDKASVRGSKLVFDFIVPNAPLNFDSTSANARAQQNMVSIYCTKQYEALLGRGAVIVHNFQSEGGRDLADGRVDAASCKLPTATRRKT